MCVEMSERDEKQKHMAHDVNVCKVSPIETHLLDSPLILRTRLHLDIWEIDNLKVARRAKQTTTPYVSEARASGVAQ